MLKQRKKRRLFQIFRRAKSHCSGNSVTMRSNVRRRRRANKKGEFISHFLSSKGGDGYIDIVAANVRNKAQDVIISKTAPPNHTHSPTPLSALESPAHP
jgi:hypothetical protein